VLGGVLVGLATLSRNDVVLLGVPFALALLADLLRRVRSPRTGASRTYAWRIGWRAAVVFSLSSETPIPRAVLYAVCLQPADTRCNA